MINTNQPIAYPIFTFRWLTIHALAVPTVFFLERVQRARISTSSGGEGGGGGGSPHHLHACTSGAGGRSLSRSQSASGSFGMAMV